MKKSLVDRAKEELLTSRNSLELWLESHSHVMAFIRTVAALSAAGLSGVVLYKVW
jgi:hypothetical protein